MTHWRQSKHADVIDRHMTCAIEGCITRARWDVSTLSRWGDSKDDWSPLCTRHAKMVVARAERNAEAPTRVLGGES